MKNPLVSVIVTTKNEELNISRLLKSIVNQSYKNIEIIVVDNNSTDKTKEISKKYTSLVFNKGPERSVQRNYGVSKAKGKYILILDADMELSKNVVRSCLENIGDKKLLIIPEKTVGKSFISRIRAYEREMYMGDSTIEVARFFEKKTFIEYRGYDENLTGTEDYDLPHRINKEHEIGWSKEYIFHHEENISFFGLLKKKYYYAKNSARYVYKHPELIIKQGNMVFRNAFIKNWKKFISNPILGLGLIFLKFFENTSAILGFISSVGFLEFIKVLLKTLRYNKNHE